MTRSITFTSYADVTAALDAPELSELAWARVGTDRDAAVGAGPRGGAHEAWQPSLGGDLSPERRADLRTELRRSALDIAHRLSLDEPVDLMESFAQPWCTALAMRTSGLTSLPAGNPTRAGAREPSRGADAPDPTHDPAREPARSAAAPDRAHLLNLAARVFMTAALARTREEAAGDAVAVAALARGLPGGGADPLAVQSFVAISQTLPRTLAATWHVLASHPAAWQLLRGDRGALPRAIEELLRLASPARAVFRRASADVTIGATRLAAGDEVVLRLDTANRDAARFPEPQRCDLQRGGGGHVGLGRGTHRCAGAALVRLAIGEATSALLDVAGAAIIVAPVPVLEGFAIRAPCALQVVLQRDA